ncbi:E3 ubiquitin-protein ligase TRAIP-like [Aricia agestis]|uniref:E3 ubiquitin-protein ligase TRAIP-like n=1 Tax=Aricia agestis TaxID=91739 RepID=UPI001C201E3D|nr:E3 ubiquitin-protein ligase TRAIP-like [Aricia agestis]
MHILCTICSDLINQADNIQVTKCGHIFHYQCLIQWIVRSKSCPQCRNKVTEKCMFRMYPTISNENTGDDVTTLQSRLDDAQLQLRQQKASSKELEEKINSLDLELKKNIGVLKATEKKLDSKEAAVTSLKEQLDYVKIQNRETQKLKEENESLKKNIQLLNGLQKVLNATSSEVEQMLASYSDLRTIATFATALKRALCDSESKKNESRDRIHALKQQLTAEKSGALELQTKLGQLEEKFNTLERKYECLKNKRKAVEALDMSVDECEPNKLRKSSELDLSTTYIDDYESPAPAKENLNTAIRLSEDNTSFNTLVTGIEDSDSPYLRLRHSGLALAALQRRPQHALGAMLKPSELAVLNSAKSTQMKPRSKMKYSIFEQKEKPPITLSENDTSLTEMNISYDGLGGHSKLDEFPVPNNRPALKSYMPKLTTRHKLKRPTPVNNHDIGKMMEKLQDKLK